MRTWKQKFLTWLLVSLMLTICIPSSALAFDPAVAVPLEQAIQTVKQNFVVPPEYTTFKSGFNEYDNKRLWSLNWTNPAENGGNFNAQVDAATGEIISMNCWKPETSARNRIPAISLPQAQAIGTQLLQRLIPNRVASLTLIPGSELISLTSYSQSNYIVRWQRLANNIPVIGEGVTMEISTDTGIVKGYSLNWSNSELPSPTGVISSETACQLFRQEGIIQLEYVLSRNVQPLDSRMPKRSEPILVYRLDHPSNGRLDALTGKPIVPEPNEWFAAGMGGYSDEMAKMNGSSVKEASPVPLSPQEQAEIAQTSGLISQEEATNALKKWVDIPSHLNLQSANLEQDWRDPSLRIWNLSWSSPSPKSASTLLRGMYGRVNAQTGDLLSFNLDIPQRNNSDNTISQENAKTLAEDFLKKVQPARFNQLKLDQISFDREKVMVQLPDYYQNTWSFNYQRTVNGILFPDNGADVRVDRATQQIVSYNLNWLKSDFPAATNVLGLDKANEVYLQLAPLTLGYTTYYRSNRGTPEMRLTYQPQIPPAQPYFNMIDASTGERLNTQGEPVTNNLAVHVFKDIAGNFAEREIALLGQAGLMGEYQDSFHPDEAVRLVTLLRTMLATASGPDYARNLSDQDIIKRSLVLGWIKEDRAPDSAVTRGLLAQLMVRSLALEYLAQLPDIYQLPYQDAIGPDLKGYAALTWGLGIIRSDGITFDAQHTITRAEAAHALVKTLGTRTLP